MSTAAAQASSTRPLGDALRRVDLAKRLNRQRHLGVDYDLTLDSERWTFRMRAEPRSGQWAHVHINDQACCVQARTEHAQAIGERSWQDYSGDARLLAWSLAHDTLIASVGRLLDGTVTPISLVSAPARVGEALAGPVLEFTWMPDISNDEPTVWRGALALDDAALANILDRARTQPGPADASALSTVPVPVSVHCNGPHIDANALLTCAPGDTIVLGTRHRLWQQLEARTTGNAPLPLVLRGDGDSIHVSLTQDIPTRGTHAMSDPSAANPTPAALSSATAERIPVQLAIQTAPVNVTLSELANVEAGVVLPLDAPVAGTNVTILANGATVGEGELVAAGEKLAVCITRWRPDGL